MPTRGRMEIVRHLPRCVAGEMGQDVLIDVACLLASIALQLWCFAARPVSWHTATGWYMEGVGTGEARPAGAFSMRPAPAGNPDADGTHGHPDTTPFDERVLIGRIYCTGGATPHVSAHSVWCQR